MIQEYRVWDKRYKVMYEVTIIDLEARTVEVKRKDGTRECISFKDIVLMPAVGNDLESDRFWLSDVISVIEERVVLGFYQEIEFVGVVKYSDEEKCYYVDLTKKPEIGGDPIPDEIDGMKIYNSWDEEGYPTIYNFDDDTQPEDITVLGNIFENPELAKKLC